MSADRSVASWAPRLEVCQQPAAAMVLGTGERSPAGSLTNRAVHRLELARAGAEDTDFAEFPQLPLGDSPAKTLDPQCGGWGGLQQEEREKLCP